MIVYIIIIDTNVSNFEIGDNASMNIYISITYNCTTTAVQYRFEFWVMSSCRYYVYKQLEETHQSSTKIQV